MMISLWPSCCASHTKADNAKKKKTTFDALKNYDVFPKPPRWKPAMIGKLSQRPVLSALSSNGNTLLPDPLNLTLTTSDLHSIFLTHMLYLSFSLSLSPFAGRSQRFIPAESSSTEGLVLAIYGLIRLT